LDLAQHRCLPFLERSSVRRVVQPGGAATPCDVDATITAPRIGGKTCAIATELAERALNLQREWDEHDDRERGSRHGRPSSGVSNS
jgi:hypothetical protein